ncbi:hypothetical protein SAMN05216274_10558 [Cryobacterium levicorallinum]|uniref:Uncharacterized protein n=1 Tax=Cryobacterium levicorallinum TaxID=995038 RepID=A0ABY1ECD3_9MICO|nr:hypothetical protein SAMN05216274_10558 [Cryobacterium levicorallinum]
MATSLQSANLPWALIQHSTRLCRSVRADYRRFQIVIVRRFRWEVDQLRPRCQAAGRSLPRRGIELKAVIAAGLLWLSASALILFAEELAFRIVGVVSFAAAIPSAIAAAAAFATVADGSACGHFVRVRSLLQLALRVPIELPDCGNCGHVQRVDASSLFNCGHRTVNLKTGVLFPKLNPHAEFFGWPHISRRRPRDYCRRAPKRAKVGLCLVGAGFRPGIG